MDFARRHESGTCGAQLVMMDDGEKVVHTCKLASTHKGDHGARYPRSETNPIFVWVDWSRED